MELVILTNIHFVLAVSGYSKGDTFCLVLYDAYLWLNSEYVNGCSPRIHLNVLKKNYQPLY
jgi:hypothetical protein